MMRIPKLVAFAVLASVGYGACAWWLDRGPEFRPLRLPYRLIDRLERDGALRSSWHTEHTRVARARPVTHDFDLPERLPDIECGSELEVASAAEGAVPGMGALEVSLAEVSADGGLVCELPCPDLRGFHSLVLEARVRIVEWSESSAPDTPIPPGAAHGPNDPPAASAAAAVPPDRRSTLRVHVEPAWIGRPSNPDAAAGLRLEAAPAMPEGEAALSVALQTGEWTDLRVGIALDPDAPPPRCAVTFVGAFRSIALDELRLRAGTRLEGMLAGGHARGLGVTEATRELKRLVRRGDEERTSLLLPGSTTLTYSLEVPPRCELRYSVAALSAENGMGNTELEVLLLRRGEFPERLGGCRVSTVDRDFRSFRHDLGRYAGEEVQVRFDVRAEESSRSPVLVLADAEVVGTDAPQHPNLILVTAPAAAIARGLEQEPTLLSEAMACELSLPQASAERDLLALFSHADPPPLPPPSATAVPSPSDRVRSLASALRMAGYETFAAPSDRGRRGWLLEGFCERWLGAASGVVEASIEALDQHQDQACFLWIQLDGGTTATDLRRLLDALRGREALERSLLVVYPESDGSRRDVPLYLRPPNPDPRQPPPTGPIQRTELAPALLRALGVADDGEWGTPIAPPFAAVREVIEQDLPRRSIPERTWSSEYLPSLATSVLDRTAERWRGR